MRSLARGLGIAAAAFTLVELLLFLRGIPAVLTGAVESLPPFVVIALFYLPGPSLALATFVAWTRLRPDEQRELRWVPFAAGACMFAPMLPSLLLLIAGLIGALLAR